MPFAIPSRLNSNLIRKVGKTGVSSYVFRVTGKKMGFRIWELGFVQNNKINFLGWVWWVLCLGAFVATMKDKPLTNHLFFLILVKKEAS